MSDPDDHWAEAFDNDGDRFDDELVRDDEEDYLHGNDDDF